MELKSGSSQHTGRAYLFSGLSIFASALIYYVVFRSQLPWPGYLLNLDWAHLGQLTDHTKGSYPSFAFSLSMGLIGIALFITHRSFALTAVVGIWFIGLLHETSMGTFAVVDVLAGTIGAAIALLIGILATSASTFSTRATSVVAQKAANCSASAKTALTNRLKLITLMLVSLSFATGTSEYDERINNNCFDSDVNGTCISSSTSRLPQYMSYDALRSAVMVTEPRTLTSVSRIYLYKNYLFANELNEGIHIIDNSVPSSPKRLGFIEIPGNQDIAIRDNSLYADSYIDLVTIDVSNINNVNEIARIESVFPYNSRQNIPDNIILTGPIDRSLGVVVGYR